jgi:flagellar hook-associated protein 1 FlgK
MGVNFATFEIPRSGMLVNERALNVTGHNIANVNTKGYVRQRVDMADAPYAGIVTNTGNYKIGLGADVQGISQIRHSFLDGMYRMENEGLGYWAAREKTLEEIQTIISEPMENGLQHVLNEFWDSWQELSKAPDSLTVRALVIQRGEAVVQHVNHLGSQLDKLQNDLNTEIAVRIGELNNMIKQIADLNVKILKYEVASDSANDFRDQRNVLMDELTNMVNVNINEMQDGQVAITLGGHFIVYKGEYEEIYAKSNVAGSPFYVPRLVKNDLEVSIGNGQLKGLLESRGEVIGGKGSFENGSPNTMADINIAVDVSDSSAATLTKIQASINEYVDELNLRGLDYNLNLITYDGSGVVSSTSYGDDTATFITDINALSSTASTGNDFGSVVTELQSYSYRTNAKKYLLNFTGESIGGDGNVLADATVDGYLNDLTEMDFKTYTITDTAYYEEGDIGEKGWQDLYNKNQGGVFDISEADYDDLMADLNTSVAHNLNQSISAVDESNNILSTLKKKLNAMINIIAREVNYHHKKGYTLGDSPVTGVEFFGVIDDDYDIEMGNLRLNTDIYGSLKSLNNVVASRSGAAGDNDIALKIAHLREAHIMKDLSGILSVDDYYQALILGIGHDGAEAARIKENQQQLVDSADYHRESIMGVSMDEEMANLMQYKYGYNAAAKILNVIDEMMEGMVRNMGHVGR